MDIKNINDLKFLLYKHLETLKQNKLNDKDMQFLLDSLKTIETYLHSLKEYGTLFKKEEINEILNLMDQIISLGNAHKDRILQELSKYNIRKKAFYSYNIENPNLKSINKKV